MKLTFVDAGPTRSIHRARAVEVVTIHPNSHQG